MVPNILQISLNARQELAEYHVYTNGNDVTAFKIVAMGRMKFFAVLFTLDTNNHFLVIPCFLSGPNALNCYGNYVCDDGSCVSLAKVCNGVFDCKDGSDEMKCGEFSI